MGLVLKKIAPTNGSGLSVSGLNLVPTVYQPEPISLTRVLVAPSAVIAISLLLFLALMTQSTAADITKSQGQLNDTNQLLQQKMAERQKYTDVVVELQKKITSAETSGGDFALAVSRLEAQGEEVNGNLKTTVNLLPETVSLTSISYTSDSLTLKGLAPAEEDILSYLRELEASGRFARITITSLKRTAQNNMDFSIILGVGE